MIYKGINILLKKLGSWMRSEHAIFFFLKFQNLLN